MSTRKPRRWVKMFQAQFVPKVQDGTKTTTIRPLPKLLEGWPKPGDTLDARYWTGKPYRSKQASILTAKITKVFRVEIWASQLWIGHMDDEFGNHLTLGTEAGRLVLDTIAIRDGFTDWADMTGWFALTHGLPFTGVMIEWEVAS